MFKFIRQSPLTFSIALAAVLALLLPAAFRWFELDTSKNLMMQLPQMIGCHLLHWSFDHASWDLLMFLLVGMICERRNKSDYAIVLLFSALAIPACVACFVPTVSSYRGLSGIDTAIFAYAAFLLIDESIKESNWQTALIYGGLYVGMLGKIGYELTFGGTLFVSSDSFAPVPMAHIVGAVIGSLVAGSRIILPATVFARVSNLDRPGPQQL